jgi:hypothetical protein
MIHRGVALLLVGFFSLQAPAAPLPAPPDLPAAIQRQAAARETLTAQAEDGLAALRKWYEASLDAVRADAANKANLDAVLATDAERGRMDRNLTAEELAALPKLLRDLRGRYDQARLQRVTQHKSALIASLREYMVTLDGLEKSLTRKLDIEGAVAARKERAAAGDEISVLAVPGAVVALGRPAPVAAVGPAAPVLPGPSLPGPVKVASELKAYGTIQAPSPNAIPFEMPRTPPTIGPVADGGRGVLLKNDPKTGWNGSTWSVTWTYNPISFYGLTFIHPFGAGQLMVRLRSNRFEPVSRNGWETQPLLAGGAPTFFKSTEGAPDPFPLQPNRKYVIVGQLDANGHYTLSIDGQVVRTTEYGSPDHPHAGYASPVPITLPEGFKGEGLPMKWEAGYAGLFVWPTVADALNLCEDITFQTGAPAQAAAAPAPAAPPSAVAPPSTVIPPVRVTPPAGATPVAVVPGRATPEPIRATSLSASSVGTAPVLAVASELKAFGTIQNPAKDAVPFEVPQGVARSKGGRGVLIKNDPGVGRRGSTWSFEWSNSIGNTGVMLVHPFGGGQVIVHIGPSGAAAAPVRPFQSEPTLLGGGKTFKDGPAADSLPLKYNHKYLIVSQFDPKGRYTLTIDGKVVQTGSFTKAEESVYVSLNPLTLPASFHGENLPTKWKAGYAAFIVAPVYDAQTNVCENITFQGSAPQADSPAR